MKKRILNLLIVLIGSATVYAQAPDSFKYQAVVRDASSSIIANQNVSFKLSVYKTSITGVIVYSETHNVTTNSYGLANMNIGGGTLVSGNFSTIDWGNDLYFIKTELDVAGGSAFSDMGISQLQSVPYALNAKTVSGMGLDGLTDVSVSGATVNQVLSWNGTNWVPITSSGGTTYSAGTGMSLSGTTFSNSSPDQTVTLGQSGATSVSGTYPNFTISSTDNNTTYGAGTGMGLSGTTFSAQTTTALWNANQLQGRIVATTAPATNQVMGWNGAQWTPQTLSTPTSLWTASGGDIYRSAGKVGIGTTTPVHTLDIILTQTNTTLNRAISAVTNGFTDNTTNSFGIRSELIGNGSLQNMAVYGEASGAVEAVTGTNFGGRFISSATTGANSYGLRSSANGGATIRNYGIYGESSANSGTFNMGGILIADGGGTGSANTNYGLYAASTNAGTGVAYSVYGEGGTDNDYAGYFNGNLAYNGTLTNVSDMRLKENIKEFSNCLGMVNSLKIYTYNYAAKGDYATLNLAEGKQYGFLAQDLEKVFPELVKENQVPNVKGVKEGDKVEHVDATYKSVNHIGMIPILTKAIQEQQDLIESQQKLINALEKRISKLEK